MSDTLNCHICTYINKERTSTKCEMCGVDNIPNIPTIMTPCTNGTTENRSEILESSTKRLEDLEDEINKLRMSEILESLTKRLEDLEDEIDNLRKELTKAENNCDKEMVRSIKLTLELKTRDLKHVHDYVEDKKEEQDFITKQNKNLNFFKQAIEDRSKIKRRISYIASERRINGQNDESKNLDLHLILQREDLAVVEQMIEKIKTKYISL